MKENIIKWCLIKLISLLDDTNYSLSKRILHDLEYNEAKKMFNKFKQSTLKQVPIGELAEKGILGPIVKINRK